MSIFYLVVDNEYIKKYGFIRSMRFSRIFDDLYKLCSFLATQEDSQDFKIIAINEEEYSKLKEKKLCF